MGSSRKVPLDAHGSSGKEPRGRDVDLNGSHGVITAECQAKFRVRVLLFGTPSFIHRCMVPGTLFAEQKKRVLVPVEGRLYFHRLSFSIR